ncbi:polysaccharide pyruvyl transferase family protein [Mesorhizobium sp. M0203]|uniref:polysaccharide pyruvyl transferase family protein n=1 Tax=Mesorhizobium sp. M0203 TaxID=2956912 RepID=UPI003339CF9C
MGARKFLHTQGKILVDKPGQSDAIVLSGGAGMTTVWRGNTFSRLENYIKLGAKNIIVLPSTVHLPEEALRRAAKLTVEKRCNLTIFAREKPSFDRLKHALADVSEIHLGHDLAFFLSPDDFGFLKLRRPLHEKYTLVVERRDAESSTEISKPTASRLPFKHLIPMSIKRPLKRRQVRNLMYNTEFVERCRTYIRDHANYSDDIIAGDISIPSLYSFYEFVSYSNYADATFTTRLHVSILCAVLDRPCYLVRSGGELMKNESVFEQSMADGTSVKLMT